MRRSAMTTFMLVITLASPSLAQKTKVADQQMRQQAEAIVTKFVDALNKGDAEAYAALFVSGGINITPFGKFKSGDTQFAESIEVPHKKGLTLTAKVDDVEPIYGGEGAVATAPYTGSFTNNPGTSQVQGNLLFVLERAGDSWKIRAHSASRQIPATEGKYGASHRETFRNFSDRVPRSAVRQISDQQTDAYKLQTQQADQQPARPYLHIAYGKFDIDLDGSHIGFRAEG